MAREPQEDAAETELYLIDYALEDTSTQVSLISLEDNNAPEPLPEPLETQVKAAQLIDDTAKRVVRKLLSRDRKDHEVTLIYTIVREGTLYINNKL